MFLHFFGRRIGEPFAGWIASATIGSSFIFGLIAALPFFRGEAHPETVYLFDWIPGLGATAELLWDPLSALMVLVVSGVGTLIHIYSIGYMHGDERFGRFFTYLNLFAMSMLTLVLANNFAVLFLGWELVGLCSYLLISFWFTRPSAAAAGKKAFIVNRIGDFGFMIALMLVFTTFGTLSYSQVLENPGELLGAGTATAIGLLFLVGAAGKSAQIPLYVWLPDAMEGPTPVSALIHAATMVTAGVYVVARTAPIYALSDTASLAVATVGALTALLAATIAVAQKDIKRVLAYSTISQLGYMFIGVGSAAYVAGVFHLMTHAFFKALLFLGAGSVIHAMADEQNMNKMGGLFGKMKITGWTMGIATLAIAGIPPLAGFWSKDEILGTAFEKGGFYYVLWAIGLITAMITAFYMARMFILTFLGKPRWDEGVHPHESPYSMTVPLMVLAVLSVVGGLVNTPFRLGLEHFLEPSFRRGRTGSRSGGRAVVDPGRGVGAGRTDRHLDRRSPVPGTGGTPGTAARQDSPPLVRHGERLLGRSNVRKDDCASRQESFELGCVLLRRQAGRRDRQRDRRGGATRLDRLAAPADGTGAELRPGPGRRCGRPGHLVLEQRGVVGGLPDPLRTDPPAGSGGGGRRLDP